MAGCASIRVAEMEAAGSHSSREGCRRRSSSARRAAAFTFGMLDQLYRAGPGWRSSRCNGRLEKENSLKPFKYAGEKASRL